MTSEPGLDWRWQAVLGRDRQYEACFVYAVASTGIYCRPTCPSRRPRRDRVRFFASAIAAEAAGFRPCKRCQPQSLHPADSPSAKVLLACRYLEAHRDRIPALQELGEQVGLSPSHLQRQFKKALGISPYQYGDALRRDRLKQALKSCSSVTAALYETGYGSSSRLYETALSQLGMTPMNYQQGAKDQTISYAIARSPLGYLLVAATEVGLCHVRLGEAPDPLEQELRQEFPAATLQPQAELQAWIETLIDYLSGNQPWPQLPVDVKATAFQRQVWEALRQIPAGTTLTYSQLAEKLGQPQATRAVARACATNPVALAIPCHRIVPKSGGVGGYRWGAERKQQLLALEKLEKTDNSQLSPKA